MDSFVHSYKINKKASSNSRCVWVPAVAWDNRNGEWEQLQTWFREAMPVGSSILWHNVPGGLVSVTLSCLLILLPRPTELLGGPDTWVNLAKPFFFLKDSVLSMGLPKFVTVLCIVCGSISIVHRMIRVLYLTMIPSTWEAAGRGSLWVPGQPRLHNETLSKQRAKTIMLSLTFESAVSSSSLIVPPLSHHLSVWQVLSPSHCCLCHIMCKCIHIQLCIWRSKDKLGYEFWSPTLLETGSVVCHCMYQLTDPRLPGIFLSLPPPISQYKSWDYLSFPLLMLWQNTLTNAS